VMRFLQVPKTASSSTANAAALSSRVANNCRVEYHARVRVRVY
jgi:hypothetical protein